MVTASNSMKLGLAHREVLLRPDDDVHEEVPRPVAPVQAHRDALEHHAPTALVEPSERHRTRPRGRSPGRAVLAEACDLAGRS